MICQLCGKAEGKHKVTIFELNKFQDTYVCDDCFRNMEKQSFQETFSMLMLPLLAMTEAVRQQEVKEQTSKLHDKNCPECYELFKTFVLPLIQALHKTYHVPRIKKKRTRVDELKGNLTKAIREERFEDAAKLRDELHNIEHGVNTETNGSSEPGPA